MDELDSGLPVSLLPISKPAKSLDYVPNMRAQFRHVQNGINSRQFGKTGTAVNKMAAYSSKR